MKAHHYIIEDKAVLALEVAPGRMERIATLPKDHYGWVKRFALAWNAVDGLGEKSLGVLADGGGSSGTLAERALAWSIFVAAARPTARRYMTRARQIIDKQGEV